MSVAIAPLHLRCATCEYLELHDKDEGYCHRYPPTSIGESTHWKFPHISIHNWCGEHFLVQSRPLKDAESLKP